MKASSQLIERLASEFSRRERILLVTHVNPDGDAIGSMLGLYWFLVYMQKQVSMAVPNKVPFFLEFLPGCDRILTHEDQQQASEEAIRQSDLIICLDFNETSRLGGMEEQFLKATAEKILIDHHPEPARIAGQVVSDTGVSSTAEILYELICGIQGNAEIDHSVATCLFTGIMTDTGCFQHNSSTPDTYRAVASLLEAGIDKDDIYEAVYETYSTGRMRLMGYCLNQKMVVLEDIRTAYISLSKKELHRFHHRSGDTEGFVNLPFSIRGIMVTALILEKEDHVKLSFRSREEVEINHYARTFFSGGGHKHAAGGESDASLEETIRNFESSIRQFLSSKYVG